MLKFAWIFGKFKHDSLLLYLNFLTFAPPNHRHYQSIILVCKFEI